MLGFIVAVALAKRATVAGRGREDKNHSAVAVAPRVEAELVIRGNVVSNVGKIQLLLAILIEEQPVARIKIIDEDDRILHLPSRHG